MILAIVRSMRPKQWLKNLFIFAGLLFTLDSHHPTGDIIKVVLAFIFFCILSGSIYIINDTLDAERDKKHPVKSRRPIASGKLPRPAAWASAVVLLFLGLAGPFALDKIFGWIALGYALLQVAYSFAIKSIVLLDVMTIAAGFVMRAVAGAAVIRVTISPWLLMCTILLALFLGLAKRRGELIGLKGEAANHRSSLEHYSVPFLDQLLNITSASAIIAYALYTFFSKTGAQHPYMMATLPFVIYGIFRYLMLIHNTHRAESPELLLLSDKPLLVNILLWAATSAVIVTLS